jgi:hypothetical protein
LADEVHTVARVYAGILGSLALLICLLRGMIRQDSPEGTLVTACLAMWAFAAVGYLIGWAAERTVEESVVSRLSGELTARRPASQTNPPT